MISWRSVVVVVGMGHGIGRGRCIFGMNMSILERGIHLGNIGVVLIRRGGFWGVW